MNNEKSKPIIVNVWIKVGMHPITNKVKRTVKVGTKSVTKTKGVFSKTNYEEEEPILEEKEIYEPTGKYSTTDIDVVDLKDKMNQVCNDLENDGYDILTITPINSGVYDYGHYNGNGFGYGYGVTDTVMITGKLRKEN